MNERWENAEKSVRRWWDAVESIILLSRYLPYVHKCRAINEHRTRKRVESCPERQKGIKKKFYKPTAFDNPLVKLFSTLDPPIKTSKTFL